VYVSLDHALQSKNENHSNQPSLRSFHAKKCGWREVPLLRQQTHIVICLMKAQALAKNAKQRFRSRSIVASFLAFLLAGRHLAVSRSRGTRLALHHCVSYLSDSKISLSSI
jgi:hypothetical protein